MYQQGAKGERREAVPIVLVKADHPICLGGSTCGDAQRRLPFLPAKPSVPFTSKKFIVRGAQAFRVLDQSWAIVVNSETTCCPGLST